MSSCCNICTDNFNRNTRREIQCPRCPHTACASCVERYLLGSMMDAHCMDCREVWDPIFLRRNMTASFMNGAYKKHREAMLWERHRALLPATMPLVEMDREIPEIRARVTQMKTQISNLKRQVADTEYLLRRREAAFQNAIETGVLPPAVPEDPADAITPTAADATRTHYQRACQNDGCNGFISSRTGECPSCKHFTCLECNIDRLSREDRDDHECKEDDVAQWTMIKESSKPCPGCGARISKESGCDQMWCPNCHTAFSWSKGTIERGNIHNPHYFDWMFSQNNRDGAGAAAAGRRRGGHGGCVDPNERSRRVPEALQRRETTIDGNARTLDWEITEKFRRIVHCERVDLPRLARNVGNADRVAGSFVKSRLDFLNNRIDEEKLRVRLQRIDKANTKAVEFNQICHTFVALSLDVFDRFITDTRMTKQEVLHDLLEIKVIAKKGVEDLNRCYSSKVTLEGFFSISLK